MRLFGLLALIGVASAQDEYLTPSIAYVDQRELQVFARSGLLHPTGLHQRAESNTLLLWEHTFTPLPGAPWVYLQFGQDTKLSENDVDGVTLKIWSEYDGHVQLLNAHTIRQWDFRTAHFNGDTVTVQLLATPDAGQSEVSVIGAVVGEPETNRTWPTTLCGTTDQRRTTTWRKAGRYVGGGYCTGFLVNDVRGCLLTAGHCTGTGTMQFNVPQSTSGGSPVAPGPNDQYPVDAASIQTTGSGGVGNDWKYYGTFNNANTGRGARDVQGDSYRFTERQPTSPAVHTGYGSTSPAGSLHLTQKGQPGGGALTSSTSTTLRYRFDTTGGDSGSAVEDSQVGLIGVHTHGGCAAGSATSSNAGTNIRVPALQTALNNGRGVCARFLSVELENQRYGVHFRGNSAAFGGPKPVLF